MNTVVFISFRSLNILSICGKYVSWACEHVIRTRYSLVLGCRVLLGSTGEQDHVIPALARETFPCWFLSIGFCGPIRDIGFRHPLFLLD